MTRKSRRPYGDDFDDADVLQAGEQPSRTARKRQSHDLRRLGEELVALRPERFARLPLPERLHEAVLEARRLTSFGARRRQVQYIGKLMRQLDEQSLAAVRDALQRD